MTRPKVSSHRSTPTETDYAAAVSAMVRSVQGTHDLTDKELADRVGCDAQTIANARNRKGKLNPVTLVRFDHEFGAGTVDPVLGLAGARSVSAETAAGIEALPPLAASVHSIAAAMSAVSPGGAAITHRELLEMMPVLVVAQEAITALVQRGHDLQRGVAA